MHTFKRFYLLGSLLAAFTIPFMTFVEYIEIPVVTQITEQSNSNAPIVSSDGLDQYPADYLPTILWSIYAIGIAVFGFKFFKNLSQIIQRIRKNPKLRINRITNVLLRDSVIPHTFLNYIFLNKQKFEAKEIPAEVLLHEETHARQKHSFDVLFTEFVQLIFWFNPFIYVLKKAVKLNHEFLADREVVRKGIKPSIYQNILLEFSSNSVQPQLANAINYSSIKKRFTVMKTKTSKKSILLRSLATLPLLALLFYGFSEKEIRQIEIHSKDRIQNESLFQNTLQNQEGATKLQIQEYNALAKKYYELPHNAGISRKEIERINFIYEIMTDTQRADAEPFPFPDFSKEKEYKFQEGATREQIKVYNALASKYNKMSKDNFRVIGEDVRKLEYIYSMMSEKQRKNAEPFPDFPDPPEPPSLPPAPNTPDSPILKNLEKSMEVEMEMQEKAMKQREVEMEKQEEAMAQQEIAMQKQEKAMKEQKIEMEKRAFTTPPPPPPPKSPIEHVREMAKKDAIFYYEGKKISSDKAITILKENKKINLRTRHEGLKKPIVELSTKPIIIKK